eukprot:scaffold719_cov359-Prasinococcus_capsulatus_cf.AAC.9
MINGARMQRCGVPRRCREKAAPMGFRGPIACFLHWRTDAADGGDCSPPAEAGADARRPTCPAHAAAPRRRGGRPSRRGAQLRHREGRRS